MPVSAPVTPDPGRTIDLRYDGQGNRKQLKIDGLPSHTYTPGPANEYTQVNYGAHAGGIAGTSSQPGNVLVGNDLAERQYSYFYRGFLPSTNASWTFEDIFAAKPPPSGGYVTAYRAAQKELYLPPASVAPVYDAAGNLKEDGWWEYEYDGENRLIRMTSAAFLPNSTNKRELLFKYDYLGRRVQKTVNKRTIGGGTLLVSDTAYAYWDWHLIAEVGYLEDSPSILRHYAWGLDKEGVRPGAGGVGGLLMISDHGAGKKTYLAMNDYIGNVIGLLDPDTGSTVAEYEYDPFGRTIRATGTFADKNPIRFSSQYTDNETGLVYFGFRYYHPEWGRFLNRDPIEEEGGENLYRFVSNDPVNRWDHLGLGEVDIKPIPGGGVRVTVVFVMTDIKITEFRPTSYTTDGSRTENSSSTTETAGFEGGSEGFKGHTGVSNTGPTHSVQGGGSATIEPVLVVQIAPKTTPAQEAQSTLPPKVGRYVLDPKSVEVAPPGTPSVSSDYDPQSGMTATRTDTPYSATADYLPEESDESAEGTTPLDVEEDNSQQDPAQ